MTKANKQLCTSLLQAESEKDVKAILKNAGYWNDETAWEPFGNNENNWSNIGNQQGNPVSAMVEKLVNSIDAVLMGECLRRGIDPESSNAPQSISEALDVFFDIPKGDLLELTPSERGKFASEIGFLATGSKSKPCYIVYDKGEGQTPDDMPNTLLSLSKSNKLRIPFVQGKFNMGGTGVLPFCGEENLQLIISRRDPQIVQSSNNPRDNQWSFTLVRREPPQGGRRSSMFTYLAPNGKILSFDSRAVTMPYGEVQNPDLNWGTVIKMYEYKMTGGYKTNIKLDLSYKLSVMLYQPGLPIRAYETRDYTQSSPTTVLTGLHVRLGEDPGANLEKGFPTSHVLHVKGQELSIGIYAFQKETNKPKSKRYRQKDGVIFVINGQTHGVVHERFFARQSVKMGYLQDSILVVVDATKISGRAREDLFMNSRDRMRDGELFKEIEDDLSELIRNHQGLRELREERRRQALSQKLDNSKPLKDVLEKIMSKSPTLANLFISGLDVSNPFKLEPAIQEPKEYIGKRFPTYFEIKPKDRERQCQLERRFRVQFETDAENDYFRRQEAAGELQLFHNGEEVPTYSANLWNGVCTLTVALPEDARVGDILDYKVTVTDKSRIDPFRETFRRTVYPRKEDSGNSGNRVNPPDGSGKGDRKKPSRFSLPNVIPVTKEEWDEPHIQFDKYSALKVTDSGDTSYDFFVNVDNLYLLNEIKPRKDEESELLRTKFKFGLVLIGLSILNDREKSEDEEDGISPEEYVFQVTKAIAPVLIPMIESLGMLQIEDD